MAKATHSYKWAYRLIAINQSRCRFMSSAIPVTGICRQLRWPKVSLDGAVVAPLRDDGAI
jgi:hypothetical protein